MRTGDIITTRSSRGINAIAEILLNRTAVDSVSSSRRLGAENEPEVDRLVASMVR
jgi:hypothetical protein